MDYTYILSVLGGEALRSHCYVMQLWPLCTHTEGGRVPLAKQGLPIPQLYVTQQVYSAVCMSRWGSCVSQSGSEEWPASVWPKVSCHLKRRRCTRVSSAEELSTSPYLPPSLLFPLPLWTKASHPYWGPEHEWRTKPSSCSNSSCCSPQVFTSDIERLMYDT